MINSGYLRTVALSLECLTRGQNFTHESWVKRHFDTVSNYLTHLRDADLARDGKIPRGDVTPLEHKIVLWNTRSPTPIFAFDDFVEKNMPELEGHYSENMDKYLAILKDPEKADDAVRKEAATFFKKLTSYVRGYEIRAHNAMMDDADYTA